MKSLTVGRISCILLSAALVALIVTLFADFGDRSSDDDQPVVVDSDQRAAIEALQAALPIQFKTDREGRVVSIVARGPQMTDDVAVLLAELPDLRDVQVEGSALGAAGIGTIAALPQVESLRMEKSEIAATDLQALVPAPNLRQLFLAECPISDDALATIGSLKALELLDLSRTQVTDEGLESLGGLSALKKLYLAGTMVTGAGFSTFAAPHGLTLLNLSGCPVDGAGLEELRRFAELESLYLDGVQFDDVLVAQLMEVTTQATPQLAGLFLSETPLTDSAIEPLKSLANLPNLSMVGLNDTRISKSAFRKLAEVTPDTRYLVDYEAGGD